ncbi:MAG: TraB/GumN family protein [Acidobacteriota bacterium]|nr:TraB/GumN family protein [Acidobacteriota bacterium]MDQ7088672.1 TraB/GumN family protein [Acidobacteriota bacterium]
MNEAQPPRAASENVTVVESGDKTIHIVGTAHVSRQSVEEVQRVIREIRPETVCIELDANRLQALTDAGRWRKLDIFQVIRQRKVPFLLANLALSAYQARLGEKLGVRPGAEMLAALEAAGEVGAEVVLADRDIQITLKRTWGGLSLWSRLKLFGALLSGFFDDEEITEEQLEELKQGDLLGEMMKEFAESLPQVKTPLIDERDVYLMKKVEQAPGRVIVAVVGAAHVPGMVRHAGEPVDLAALETLPPPSRAIGMIKWVIPSLVLAAFTWGYFKLQGQDLSQLLVAWVLPNALFAGLFSLLAGSRLLTAVSAFVASPITSLNPTIQAGMVAGLVEAWLRRPTVEDCERVREDSRTLRGLYRNRFTRVLLVSVAASLGSALGAYVGIGWMITLLNRLSA